MTKIAMIGAGSTVFMKSLVGDILHEPLLKNAEIALMDIDEQRLHVAWSNRERARGRDREGGSFDVDVQPSHRGERRELDRARRLSRAVDVIVSVAGG